MLSWQRTARERSSGNSKRLQVPTSAKAIRLEVLDGPGVANSGQHMVDIIQVNLTWMISTIFVVHIVS